jgi:bacteriorhodopsin
VDWLLTVPLLLIELVLVMGLSPEETASKTWTLGVASALMVALGYPGEVQNGTGARLQWWSFAMLPFS